MAFWQLNNDPHAVALIDHDGHLLTYAALKDAADRMAAKLDRRPSRDVGFILFDVRTEAIATYLGALRSGTQVPLLLQPTINPSLLKILIEIYSPGWIAAGTATPVHEGYRLEHDFGGYGLFTRMATTASAPPHPDCGLLLSTSGSTGSPKLVRLSYAALAHNADSIAQYLGLTSDDRAITALPLAYSFGMSILNSHLAAGGSLTLTSHNLLTREFWTTVVASDITSLSGVPSTFDMLRRAGLQDRRLARIRMLTQAGGRLSDEITRYFLRLADKRGWMFFVMYGQTEAAPRISYVPPDRLSEKIGSVGIAIPGGSLRIDPRTGELVYQGPNVMMGYALSRDDLAKPDECSGILHTGDLGRQDEDGFCYLTGRLRRFVKLAGNRVNMDEVEAALSKILGVMVVCSGTDDRLAVVLPVQVAIEDAQVHALLRDLFNIYAGSVRIHRFPEIPHLANGKLDYRLLEAMVAAR